MTKGRGFLLKKKLWLGGRWVRVGKGDRRDGTRKEETMVGSFPTLLSSAMLVFRLTR